jgi:DUF2075 family protein
LRWYWFNFQSTFRSMRRRMHYEVTMMTPAPLRVRWATYQKTRHKTWSYSTRPPSNQPSVYCAYIYVSCMYHQIVCGNYYYYDNGTILSLFRHGY